MLHICLILPVYARSQKPMACASSRIPACHGSIDFCLLCSTSDRLQQAHPYCRRVDCSTHMPQIQLRKVRSELRTRASSPSACASPRISVGCHPYGPHRDGTPPNSCDDPQGTAPKHSLQLYIRYNIRYGIYVYLCVFFEKT